MSISRMFLPCVIAVGLLSVATPSQAQLSPYSQDFEALVQTDGGALGGDGWLYFVNVFDAGGGYLYGYGPGPAPNMTGAMSDIVVGAGGVNQGAQQVVIYSDYANSDHSIGNLIETNVFQEQVIGAGDVGTTFEFEFDAKYGNVGDASSTALAFIKTLDPGAGFATTNFYTFDTTSIPVTWDTYMLSVPIDASLVGQILQFGFSNTATNFEPSANFYDNVSFQPPAAPVPGVTPAGLALLAALALAGLGFQSRRRQQIS